MNKIKSFLAWIRQSKIRLGGFILILLVLGFGINKLFRGQDTTLRFQTEQVERGTIVSSVTASGKVEVANVTNIVTNATGIVSNVYVKDGDLIKKGQKIADITLDQISAQKSATAYSSYLASKTTLDAASATQFSLQSDMFTKWKTYMELAQSSSYQNSDGSPKTDARTLPQFYSLYDDWLAAEAKYKNQQAVITQAQAAVNSTWLSYQLNSSTITAPVAGTVNNITIVPGITLSSSDTTTTNTGTRIAVIGFGGEPILTFNVSEIDIPKVKPGQKATITLDSLNGKIFTGKVLTVDRIGTVTSGVTNYPITVQLDLAAEEILPNMAANVNIMIESKNDVLLVPLSAIQNQNGQTVARVLRNNQEIQVPVEIGLTSDTQAEIVSGLVEEDTVIVGTVNSSSAQRSGSVFGGFGTFRTGGFGGGAARRSQ